MARALVNENFQTKTELSKVKNQLHELLSSVPKRPLTYVGVTK